VFQSRQEFERGFDPNDLSWLLKRCFQQRRKQLRSILKPLWSEELEAMLESWGHSGAVRPEALSAPQFHEIARKLGVFPLDFRSKI
jgi:16S rRNA (adenine1518-N6/adenine1519-N6)-dimethyltransferase